MPQSQDPQPLDVTPQKERRRRRSSRRRRWYRRLPRLMPWKAAFIIMTVVAVFVVVTQMVLITDATNQLNSSWDSFDRILETVENKSGSDLTLADYNRLESGANELLRSLAVLRGRTQFVQPLLGLRADWRTANDLLDIAQTLTTATRDMLVGIGPAINFMVGDADDETITTQLSSGERVIELLELGQGRFIRASQSLQTAQQELDALNLQGVSPELLQKAEEARQFYSQLHDINTLLLDSADLLSQVLGLERTQNYLILLQNSDELRPSGGYISTYGWMTVRSGRISDYDYSATTATSPSPPPADFLQQFTIPDWWIRYREPIYAIWDGSWHTDFPQTADMARRYYEAGNNPNTPIDGVIAIDLVGFEYIMEVLDSIVITDYDLVVTPENFRETIYDIRAVGEGPIPHKRFLASVYEEIFTAWQKVGDNSQTNTEMWGVVLRALQEKHMMIYFTNPRFNDSLDLLHWSGAQTPARDHDYIMTVDTNLGNKSNRSVIRQLTYDVTLNTDRTLSSRLSIAYNYPSIIAENDPAVDERYHGQLDYNTLLQVSVPVGTVLTGTNNLQETPEIVEDDSHTRFVSRVTVPYDNRKRFQYQYVTAPLIGRIGEYEQYRLLIQKQPGTVSDSVSVQVSLPPGAQVIDTSIIPQGSYQLEYPVLDFRLNLTTDQWLEIIYQAP